MSSREFGYALLKKVRRNWARNTDDVWMVMKKLRVVFLSWKRTKGNLKGLVEERYHRGVNREIGGKPEECYRSQRKAV